MRFGFVTCVQLGLSCMKAIYRVGGRLDLAMTLEDDMARTKSGRVYLDRFCAAHNLPLVKIRNINAPAAIEVLAAADLDWLFIIGWSQIAGAAVLGAPRKGVLGMHPTLLPTGRGRAAIPWAILKDLSETGVTMFKLDEGVDSGPIAAQHRIAMHSRTNATELYDAVERGHAVLMEDVFPRLVDDAILLTDQDHAKATEWPARTPKDGRLELGGTVEHADRLIRAVTRPYPGAFIEIGDRRLTVWAAEIATESTHFPNAPMLSFSNGSLLCSEWEEQAFEK